MNKQLIVQAIVVKLESELASLKAIVDNARNEVIHGDMKQDGKYDTRAIEAGYLAGAQKRRLQELQNDIDSIKLISIESNSTEVGVGSMVKVSKEEELKRFFIVNASGGFSVEIENKEVMVISSKSPVAKSIWSKEQGDEFIMTSTSGEVECEIISVL